jgi:hypothetical protein
MGINLDRDALSTLESSGEFDADYYVGEYPDVVETGLDPAAHFLWIGARLGRLPRAPMTVLPGARAARLDVLFVDGTNGTSSTPYRIDRVAEGLSQSGLNVRCVAGEDLRKCDAARLGARFVTFFRAPFWNPYRAFAETARNHGSRIVFDVDDLVFDEELIPIVDGYRLLTEAEKLGYVRGVRAYREFILYADFCTTPTAFLANQMSRLGKRAFMVRNTLAEAEIEKFAAQDAGRPRDRFVVGYYSGSKTHQADFRNAGEALADFKDENPGVDFRLDGQFDLSEYPRLQKWSDDWTGTARVERIGLMPHSQMLEDQLNCDVIIAPLEVGNDFCEAKSELKFFEASLVRRPIIASPTQTFRHAIGNGRFGQLADRRNEWLEAFRRAFSDRPRLRAKAERAREYVIEKYAPASAGADALAAYTDRPIDLRGPVANSNRIG